MGRRKIAMKKIEKKSSLQVTFSKRKKGLFRKASELSLLCGAQIAILVQSPSENMFAFGHPSVEAVVDRCRKISSPAAMDTPPLEDGGRSKCEYEEAVRRLEMEKNRVLKEEEDNRVRGDFWWDRSLTDEGMDMELHELEEYLQALESLKDKLSTRISEMEILQLQPNLELDLDQDFDSLNSRLTFPEFDHDQDLGSTSDLDHGFGGLMQLLAEFDHDDQDVDVGDWLQ